MRPAARLKLTPLEFRQVERSRQQAGLVRLLTELVDARDLDWYRWTVAYGRQEHLHGSRRLDGSPAACPVRGCVARGEAAAA